MIVGTIGALLVLWALALAATRVGTGSEIAGARRILDDRVAAGDLDPAQRRAMLAVLRERRPLAARRWLPWALGAVGLALLVVPGTVAAAVGDDATWANHWTLMTDHMGWDHHGVRATVPADVTAEVSEIDLGDLRRPVARRD